MNGLFKVRVMVTVRVLRFCITIKSALNLMLRIMHCEGLDCR